MVNLRETFHKMFIVSGHTFRINHIIVEHIIDGVKQNNGILTQSMYFRKLQ